MSNSEEKAVTVTLQQFMQGILASGLMTEDELREFRARLPERHLTAERLGNELVDRQRLTQYQVARVYLGQHEGLILGKNVILDRIGSGGMGEVYLAEHMRMKRSVVVKVLHAEHTKSEQAVRRFQREVEAAAQLYHPNIVTAFDADEHNGIHYLVMEYVEGKDLGSLVSRKGPFELDRALDCILQAARGLAYAHGQGIVHRDIKPSNLLLDKNGVVKVLDMGLARFESLFAAKKAESTADTEKVEELTQANQIVGTVDYMSPEQADDSAHVDRRSDIYSLGCTLYRLIVGQAPFKDDSVIKTLLSHRTDPIPSIRAICPDAPEELDRVLEKMMAKLPEDRYQNMDEVIADLEICLEMICGVPEPSPSSSGILVRSRQPRRTASPPPDPTDVLEFDEDTRSSSILTAQSGLRLNTRRLRTPAVGIDLGTTYSVVACLDDLGRPQTVMNAEGDKLTPSVLLFEHGEVVVGKEALKAMATEMDFVAECAKRDLGRRSFHKSFNGHAYPPEALEGWILNKLRTDAWNTIGRFEKCVITVPAYFGEVHRKATQDAGYIAGFDVMDIINEPTAAAVAFGFQQGYLHPDHEADEKKKILVYDLGGGTFDVTVMEIGGVDFMALATDGDVKLGGRDWDQRLVDFVAEEFIRKFGADPRDEPNAAGRLWRECEDAKRTLSARTRTSIGCDFRGQTLRVTVTRQQFEEMTQDLLDRTVFTTEHTLRAAGLKWDDIDRVLLVGGSTRMPAVVNQLQRLCGKAPDCSVSPDEAVAHGAALHAGLLLDRFDGKSPRFNIRNVNSHSLGVVGVERSTGCKQTAVLIPRNTALPATAKRVFRTSKPNQQSVLVTIVEGESENPDACVQLGRCAVRSLPPNLPENSPIEVVFHYAENGRLIVRVRVPGMSEDVRHDITRENSLDQQQLNAWRRHVCQLPPPTDGSEDTEATRMFSPPGE